MRKIVFGLATIAALIGTPAFAADIAVKAPPPAPVPAYSWTGFYVGANVGYGWDSDRSVTFSPNQTGGATVLASDLGPGAPISFNTSGAVGGFQLGYNWQLNPTWLIGFETDFEFSSVDGSGSSSNFDADTGALTLSSTANEKVYWFGTVRGRLGYLPTNNLLLYATGGFAYGRVNQNVSYSNVSPGGGGVVAFDGSCLAGTTCYLGTSDRTATGWTAGAGLEYALSKNWLIRTEYLYVDLGTNTFNQNVLAPGTSSATSSFAAHFSDVGIQIVRAGLNYKF